MSKFVLVEFEDDDTADRFVASTMANTDNGKPYRIAGVYQRPNAWCGCPFQVQGVNRPVSRGKKYGWWICGWCKKPRPGTQQLVSLENDTTPLSSRKFTYVADTLSVYEVPNRS